MTDDCSRYILKKESCKFVITTNSETYLSIPTAIRKKETEAFREKLNNSCSDEREKFSNILNCLGSLYIQLSTYEDKSEFLTNIKMHLDNTCAFPGKGTVYLEVKELIEKNEIEWITIDDLGIYFKIHGPFEVDFNSSNAIGGINFNDPNQHPDLQEKVLRYSEAIAGKFTDTSSKLRFLKEVLFTLHETGRKFIDKPDHLQNMTALDWETYLTSKTRVDSALAIDVCERYLELCEAEANQEWFERRVPRNTSQEGHRDTSRESGMVCLSKKLIKLKEQQGNTPQISKQINQALQRIKRWLLLRYNLTEARKIEYSGRKVHCFWLPEIGALLALSFFICPWFRGLVGPWKISTISVFFLLFYFFFLIGTIIIFKRIYCGQKKPESISPADLQIRLPRLAAGIVVGYLLLANDEAWNAILCLDSIKLLGGKIGIPLIAVFFYILVEMNNVSGLSPRFSIFWKALLLLMRGAAYSVLIGIVISDLFGESVIKRLPQNQCAATFPGVFGYIYPEVLYLLSPLALFIGVFIQLLWEDKALTEKI